MPSYHASTHKRHLLPKTLTSKMTASSRSSVSSCNSKPALDSRSPECPPTGKSLSKAISGRLIPDSPSKKERSVNPMSIAVEPMREEQAGASAAPSVRVVDLWKKYGETEAVRGISFEVQPGEIFGLIGPDGAGKTSTFQILGGVMSATSGVTEIYGKASRDARSLVGYLTQAFSLYPDLSVGENIRYVGDLRRVPLDEITSRSHEYLSMFEMDRFIDRLAGKLSGGMKQKLSLVAAIVAQPRVLLLDEPTTGVDPVSRREFWDTLAHLADAGLTIVVATPYMDEAERCHRVALMHLGEIHQMGTPAELRGGLGLKRLEVRTGDLSAAEDLLDADEREQSPIVDVQRFGDRLDVMVRDVDAGRREIDSQLTQG